MQKRWNCVELMELHLFLTNTLICFPHWYNQGLRKWWLRTYCPLMRVIDELNDTGRAIGVGTEATEHGGRIMHQTCKLQLVLGHAGLHAQVEVEVAAAGPQQMGHHQEGNEICCVRHTYNTADSDTLRHQQHGGHTADNIFTWVSLNGIFIFC